VEVTDTLTPAERSALMRRIVGKHTRPEKAIRRAVSALGYRFRLHGAKLPGKPDLVFAGRRKVIFVHGCFWHRHRAKTCRLARMPKTRVNFWERKLDGNRKRDARNRIALKMDGWKSLVIWECQLRDMDRIGRRIDRFLRDDP
jgi:DNA mismatch endonuclease (patch repair protein)